MPDTNDIYLEHISVEGFKSIKKLDLDINSINILIGANGAGKTNFISLFTFLRNLAEGKLQTYVEKQGFANTFFHFGSKATPSIKLSVDVGYTNYEVEFEHGTHHDALIFKSERCTLKDSGETFNIRGHKGESGILPDGETDSLQVRKVTRGYLRRCRVYHFNDTGPTAGLKLAQTLDANAFLYSDARNLAPFLHYLRDNYSENYQDIVAAVKTVAPFFHDFYLEPRGRLSEESVLLRWIHRDHDSPFSVSQLSDGTVRFICMATLFLQPKELRPNTIVIDEPELGLHPAALEVLADMIKSTVQDNQVICSTQSVEFANYFAPEDFIVVDQAAGTSTFRRLDGKALELWLKDYGMGDIWSKNLIGGRPEW